MYVFWLTVTSNHAEKYWTWSKSYADIYSDELSAKQPVYAKDPQSLLSFKQSSLPFLLIRDICTNDLTSKMTNSINN